MKIILLILIILLLIVCVSRELYYNENDPSVIAPNLSVNRQIGGNGFVYSFTINKPTWLDGAVMTDDQFHNDTRWQLKVVGDQRPIFGGGYPTLLTSGTERWNYWETPRNLDIDANKYTKLRFLLKGTWGSSMVFPRPTRLKPNDAWDGFVTFYTIPLTPQGAVVNFRATNSDKDIQLRIYGGLTCQNNDCNNCTRSADACRVSGNAYYDQTMSRRNRDKDVIMYPGDVAHLKRDGKNRCVKYDDIKRNSTQNNSMTSAGAWYVPISASSDGAPVPQGGGDFATKFFVC